ncbi:hypothetical protein Dsin_014705 [Dipteronia sinensis]|uniref:Bromo domain-containing protein n=1 Tax=Dipteronia sinensis TaxID=43782 RepID=A0AAE0EBU5_9ROSI|nr:hypothetical protein Dsin_014705 [Dipteronia sinensis]
MLIHLMEEKVSKATRHSTWKDMYGVLFSEPVDPEELPDYHDIIAHPMDFTRWGSLCQLGIFRVLGSYLFFLDCILWGTIESLTNETREAVKKVILRSLKLLYWDILLQVHENLTCSNFKTPYCLYPSIMPRPEAVDLLIEVQDLDLLVEHVDITNFKRTSLRHQFGKVPSWS